MNIGIVGATPKKDKYGYKVLQNLKRRGFNALYPINPNYEEIEGFKCYSQLKSISDNIDLLVFIIPHSRGLKVLQEAVTLDIKNVWFQPGAESKEIEKFCKEYNLNYSFYRCIMVADDEEILEFIDR